MFRTCSALVSQSGSLYQYTRQSQDCPTFLRIIFRRLCYIWHPLITLPSRAQYTSLTFSPQKSKPRRVPGFTALSLSVLALNNRLWVQIGRILPDLQVQVGLVRRLAGHGGHRAYGLSHGHNVVRLHKEVFPKAAVGENIVPVLNDHHISQHTVGVGLLYNAVAAGQHLLAALGPKVRARVYAPVLHGLGVHRGPGAVGLLYGLAAHRADHFAAYLIHRGVCRDLGLLGFSICGLRALRCRRVAGFWHIGGLWLGRGCRRRRGLCRPRGGLWTWSRWLLCLGVVAPAGGTAALQLLCGGDVALHRVKGAPGRYAHRHQAHSQRQVEAVAPCLIFRKAFAVHKFASFQW